MGTRKRHRTKGRRRCLSRSPRARSTWRARCSRPKPQAILGLIPQLDGRLRRAPSTCSTAAPAGSIVTGMGKSGIIARKMAATLSSTGTSAFFLHPAEAIHGDLGVVQPSDVVVALSQSGETEELRPAARGDPPDRRATHRPHRRPRVDARPGGRRHAELPRRRGGLPDEPGAHGQHDRRARARRCAGHGPGQAQGLPAGGLRRPAPGRPARQAADAGRAR